MKSPRTLAREAARLEINELAGFLGVFFDRYMTEGVVIPPEFHPLRVLFKMSEKSPMRALVGVKMAVCDCLEMSRHWLPDQVSEADEILRAANVLTLSAVRNRQGP